YRCGWCARRLTFALRDALPVSGAEIVIGVGGDRDGAGPNALAEDVARDSAGVQRGVVDGYGAGGGRRAAAVVGDGDGDGGRRKLHRIGVPADDREPPNAGVRLR